MQWHHHHLTFFMMMTIYAGVHNIFSFSFQIAATLLKILTKLFQKPRQSRDEAKWSKSVRYWMRCLDRMITINTFLIELHEIGNAINR